MTSDKLRGAILRVLHARWLEAGTILLLVESTDLAAELGVGLRDVHREGEYLGLKGLLADRGTTATDSRSYQPTTAGIDYVEHPEVFPEYRSLIVVTAGGDVSFTGSQVGSVGNFQASVTGWNPDQVAPLIEQLRGLLTTADVEERIRQVVVSDLDALSAQVRRPAPNRPALWATFQGLSATVQAAAALQQLWPVLVELGRLLGFG